MGPIVAIGFAAFFVVSLTVGIRLLLLWRRTGKLPELLIGSGVLGIGPIGFGFATVGALTLDTHASASQVLFALSFLSLSLGAFAKFVFNWQVYRPQNRVVGGVVGCLGVLLLLSFTVQVAGGGLRNPDELTPAAMLRLVLLIGCLLWGSCESLAYWTKMRRRERLGLSDPVTTHRFLMWGLGAGFAGLGSTIGLVAQVVTGLPMIEIPGLTMSSSLHGLLAAIAIWLAFVPPHRYQQFLRARAQTAR